MQCVTWWFFNLGGELLFWYSGKAWLCCFGGVCEGWLVVDLHGFGGCGYWVFYQSQTTNSHILIITGWIHFSYKQGHRDAALQTLYNCCFFTSHCESDTFKRLEWDWGCVCSSCAIPLSPGSLSLHAAECCTKWRVCKIRCLPGIVPWVVPVLSAILESLEM